MYKYIITEFGKVIIKELESGDRLSFTENEDNPDYQYYLKWLSEGNTPELYTIE